MEGALAKLLAAGSAALSSAVLRREALPLGAIWDELHAVLVERNGFFAFESALLFRPLGGSGSHVLDIEEWNDPGLWKSSFAGLADEITFFADDIFGGQFGIRGPSIVRFNPETGEFENFAQGFDEWATTLIADYNVLTGYPIAHNWQRIFGPLKPGTRLVPLIPFVVGGDFVIENLRAAPEVRAMRFYGGLASAVAQVPDGGELQIDIKNLGQVLDREEPSGPATNG
ncbi:hypothetical protein EV382_4716 [Micromonospora violae]|uniref:SMI1/KNR4 family protein n=1 Tax=Micromonospora violae TaxID=1278207 RepID=A0A4Q7UNS8_9ACTN|nr:SMI1/KNR4 family protein [Micromonospora violae]RZT81439.1 hypothetical protein EV382_4716 [Micromonospora violae]